MSRMNIRTKLLLIFLAIFTVAFALSSVWFYNFATRQAMDNLRTNLITSAQTAADMLDGDQILQVIESGEEDDALYTSIADQLRIVLDASPSAVDVYTLVGTDDPNVLMFAVSAYPDPELRPDLGELYDVSELPEMASAFEGPSADEYYHEDEYGIWLSGYAPVLDQNDQAVAIVGVDMSADEVVAIQDNIKTVSIIVFFLIFAGVFLAAYLISGAITRSLNTLTGAAQVLESGEKFQPDSLAKATKGKDELSQLARVFSQMAVQIQAREQKLKEEVMQLRIEIDQTKRSTQVEEIIKTEYFSDLQKKAKEMRENKE